MSELPRNYSLDPKLKSAHLLLWGRYHGGYVERHDPVAALEGPAPLRAPQLGWVSQLSLGLLVPLVLLPLAQSLLPLIPARVLGLRGFQEPF